MIDPQAPTDQRTHELAQQAARRIVQIFAGILMRHEVPAALTEAYLVIRETLETAKEKP